MKTRRKRSALALAFCLSMNSLSLAPAAGLTSIFAASSETLQSLYDPSSVWNWPHSGIENGQRIDNSWMYPNLFVTHPVAVVQGDTVVWGPFFHNQVVGSVYDGDGNLIRDILFTQTEHSATGEMVEGGWGYHFNEYWFSYAVTDENAASVRLQGNTSTQSDFVVYKNLENGFADIPGSIDAAAGNCFNKASSQIWDNATLDPDSGSRVPLESRELFVTHPISVMQGETLTWNPAARLETMAVIYDAAGNRLQRISYDQIETESDGEPVFDGYGRLTEQAACQLTIRDAKAAWIRIVVPQKARSSLGVFKNLPHGFKDLARLQTVQVTDFTYRQHESLPYRIYVPEKAKSGQNVPLILFLHGAGERGTDNQSHLRVAVQPFLNAQPEVSEAIIIAPHLDPSRRWVETDWGLGSYDSDTKDHSALDEVMEILDLIEEEYPVDTDRVYIAGESMGGFGTWNLLMRYPDVFAAGIPICGGADPSKAPALKDMPIWTFHGAADTAVPFSGTQQMVSALKNAGSTQIRFTTYPGKDHEIWNEALSIPGLGAWLFSHRLSERTGSASLFDPENPDNWMEATVDGGRRKEKAGLMVTHPIAVREDDAIEWTQLSAHSDTFAELYDSNGRYLQTLSSSTLTVQSADDGTIRLSARIHHPQAAWVRIVSASAQRDVLDVWRNARTELKSTDSVDVLENQTVLFAGDAILSGAGDLSGQYGWTGRMALSHHMSFRNAARADASLTALDSHSRIITQLSGRPVKRVVLSGGAADAQAGVPVGAITDDSILSGFDVSTFTGALEELFSSARQKNPDAAIGYVFSPVAANGTRADLFAYRFATLQACQKWNVTLLDLDQGSVQLNGRQSLWSELLPSDRLPDAQEYEQIASQLEPWMSSLRADRKPDSVDERDRSINLETLRMLCTKDLSLETGFFQSALAEEWRLRKTHGQSVLNYPQSASQVSQATGDLHERLLELRIEPKASLLEKLNGYVSKSKV